MWDQGGQPWQQWPLNQQQWMQSFQHQQDPSQIDWAALAQAWIAQREASGQQNMVEQPPGMMPNGQDMSTMESGPNNHGNFQGDSNFNRMWQPEWGMHQQPPHPLQISHGCHQHQAQWTLFLLPKTATVRTVGNLPLTTGIYLTRTITTLVDHPIILQWGQ